MDSALTASQAKYEFFLTPADLASLPSMRVALFGCGNAKLFSKHNLLVLSGSSSHGTLVDVRDFQENV